ncbi:MAG TPA: hypothetical protein VJT31_24230, partial [Rugosimonospora sp.]|nr:hypothetical protein [Rugosimonospora sp.]
LVRPGPGLDLPAAPPPASQAPASPVRGTLGAVVPTGIQVTGGELMVYAVAVDEARLSGVHFGVAMGRRSSGGPLAPLAESNEVTGSDRSPGFHAVEAAMTVSGVAVPEFGYYAGPATKITASVNGHTVQARQAAWSQDPSVVFFWFDPAQVPAGTHPTGLAAYDRTGQRLPEGNASAGSG